MMLSDTSPIVNVLDGALEDLDLAKKATSEPSGEIPLRPPMLSSLAFLLPLSASLLFSSRIRSFSRASLMHHGLGLVDGCRVSQPSRVSVGGTSSTLGCSGASPPIPEPGVMGCPSTGVSRFCAPSTPSLLLKTTLSPHPQV